MDELAKTTLIKLRDKLTARAEQNTTSPDGGNMPANALELLRVSTEYGPFCEAMYLMMAADGRVLSVEREVLKGAMQTLTNDTVSPVHIEAMLDAATKRLASEGYEKRLKTVSNALKDDRVKAEVALVLAASVAYADEELDARENVTLEQLAEGLGVPSDRVAELVQEVEGELGV